jgi:hypothetical protein
MNEYPRATRLLSMGRVAVIVSALAGCARTPAASTPIRYGDLGRSASLDVRGPFVVEFQAGDRVPVHFDFSGEDFELAPAHPEMELVAKHRCFVRFSAEGVRSSLDPRTFDGKPRTPGTFRFGLKVVRGQPAAVDVAIVTPRR